VSPTPHPATRLPRTPLARAGALLAALALLTGGWLTPAHAADTGREILKILKSALKSDDEAVRSKAVIDVGRLNGHLNDNQAMVAAKALRDALDSDSSQAVRRLMIRALARFKNTHAWVPVILASQEDRDPVIKDQARQEVLSGGSDFLRMMVKLLKEETSQAFRADLLLILRDRRRPDAVPLLLDALGDKNPIVRSAAAEALEAISGKAFGYNEKIWRKWHAGWLKTRPTVSGPSVSPGGRVDEPPPHVSRSLHPKFYGLPLTSKDIVFVMDISGSVGSGGVERAKRQLVEAVALLGSDVHVSALFFSDEVHVWKKGEMVLATPTHKEDLMKFLRGLKPGRRTDVYTGLNHGLTILAKRVKAKREAKEPIREAIAMITVSDGQHNRNALPPRVVADKIDRLDPEATVLHSVVLGTKDSPLMAGLARLGGGHYLRAEP